MILASTTRFPSDSHDAIAGMNCELDRLPRQFLVRFQNKTHAISLATRDVGEKDASDEDTANRLLWVLSDRTGWKKIHLEMTSLGFPFCSARVRSSLLGGKGGFGTLLKGQSKQAGAKRTTDFGACRDLQGRRLRHVNDEIKLRKWRERQKREANGEKVDADEMWKTASGLYNWHLMVPTWADISKKETNKIKRQFQSMDRKLEKEAALRKEKDEVYQKTMTHYLDQTNSVSESVQSALKDALRQGLKKSSSQKQNTSANGHKRKRAEGSVSTEDAWVPKGDEQPNSLVSLTGDVVVEASREQNASVKIQSKSEFMTAVFVMEGSTTPPEAYYYEVTVVSGGLAQIGWASMEGFRPSNDLGDGVGDDASSYALDGSRGLKFHGGNELDCPISWKQGDRLGCLFRRSSGSLQFTLNGKDLGVIFSDVPSKPMVPAFSCNQGEILELHLSKSDCKYFPYSNETVVAVKDVVTSEDSTPLTTKQSKATDSVSGPVSKIAPVTKADEQVSLPRISTTPTTTAPKLTTPEALELDSYQSAKELEALGLDRLKSALMFLQVKCGGTLEQRAERLFSLKGLERKEYPKKVRTKGFVEEQ